MHIVPVLVAVLLATISVAALYRLTNRTGGWGPIGEGLEFTLTTIFPGKEKSRRFPGVHSRYVVASGDSVILQLRSSCEEKH